jgi:hypothetical protein
MQLVTIKKKTNGKVEQAKKVISVFCLLMDTKLSDTELTVLAYFMVYKVSRKTKDLILSSGILKSEDSLKNTLSKLKKFGLLRRSVNSKEYSLNEKLDINLNTVMGILIKIDNS